MFKKKNEPEEIDNVDTQKVEINDDLAKSIENEIKQLLKSFSQYAVYKPEVLVNMPSAAIEAEKLNLLMGIFAELRKLNDKKK